MHVLNRIAEGKHIKALQLPLSEADFVEGTFAVGDNITPTGLLDHILNHGLRHIVQRSGVTPGHEMETARRMLSEPIGFFTHPISTILHATNVSPETEAELRGLVLEFTSPREKEDTLDLLRAYLQPLVTAGLLADLHLIADELFTNAVLNAPFENWNQEVGGINRDPRLLRDLKVKPAQLIVARDQDRVVLGCIDQYGALNPLKLIERLKRVLEEGLGPALSFGPGGAGIGTSMIYGACSSLYLAVEKGKKTVVCVSLPLIGSRKARERTPKNIHVLMLDSGKKI